MSWGQNSDNLNHSNYSSNLSHSNNYRPYSDNRNVNHITYKQRLPSLFDPLINNQHANDPGNHGKMNIQKTKRGKGGRGGRASNINKAKNKFSGTNKMYKPQKCGPIPYEARNFPKFKDNSIRQVYPTREIKSLKSEIYINTGGRSKSVESNHEKANSTMGIGPMTSNIQDCPDTSSTASVLYLGPVQPKIITFHSESEESISEIGVNERQTPPVVDKPTEQIVPAQTIKIKQERITSGTYSSNMNIPSTSTPINIEPPQPIVIVDKFVSNIKIKQEKTSVESTVKCTPSKSIDCEILPEINTIENQTIIIGEDADNIEKHPSKIEIPAKPTNKRQSVSSTSDDISESETDDESDKSFSSEESSDIRCLICDKKGHTSFQCQMICINCFGPHHSHKTCTKALNVTVMLQGFTEVCISQMIKFKSAQEMLLQQNSFSNLFMNQNMRIGQTNQPSCTTCKHNKRKKPSDGTSSTSSNKIHKRLK